MVTATEMKQHLSDYNKDLDQAQRFVTENRSRLRAIDKAQTAPDQRLGGNLVKLMHLPLSPDASYNAFRRKLLMQVHTDKFRAVNDETIQAQARDAFDKTESFLKEFHIEILWNHQIDPNIAPAKQVDMSTFEAKTRAINLFNQMAQIVRSNPRFSANDVCTFLNKVKVLEQPEKVQSELFCQFLTALRSGSSPRVRDICAEAATVLLCIPQFMLTNSIQTDFKPLLLALKLDLRDLAEALTQRDEIMVNLTDEDLNTALHLAVLRNDEALVDHLLQNPSTDLTLTNSFGDTALDTAREIDNPRIIGKLLNAL